MVLCVCVYCRSGKRTVHNTHHTPEGIGPNYRENNWKRDGTFFERFHWGLSRGNYPFIQGQELQGFSLIDYHFYFR